VTIDNMADSGVTVVLAGTFHTVATTDDDGAFVFDNLRAGNSTIELLCRFDSDEIGFPTTKSGFTLGVGEVKVVSFNGTLLRTAGIRGRVTAEGEGLDSVTVNVTGGEDNADLNMTTDSAGRYAFSKLRAGDYTVALTGYDTDDYGFEAASQHVTVALRDTATVDFEGILLRTSSITGLVSIDGVGLDRVRVALSGAVEAETRTTAGGQYAFPGLPAGDYTVAISGFDEDAYTFSTTSIDVTLARDEAKIVSFEGSPVGWWRAARPPAGDASAPGSSRSPYRGLGSDRLVERVHQQRAEPHRVAVVVADEPARDPGRRIRESVVATAAAHAEGVGVWPVDGRKHRKV